MITQSWLTGEVWFWNSDNINTFILFTLHIIIFLIHYKVRQSQSEEQEMHSLLLILCFAFIFLCDISCGVSKCYGKFFSIDFIASNFALTYQTLPLLWVFSLQTLDGDTCPTMSTEQASMLTRAASVFASHFGYSWFLYLLTVVHDRYLPKTQMQIGFRTLWRSYKHIKSFNWKLHAFN